jgi:hypothetical protein
LTGELTIAAVTVGDIVYRLVELIGGGFCVIGPDGTEEFTDWIEAEGYFWGLCRKAANELRMQSVTEAKDRVVRGMKLQ